MRDSRKNGSKGKNKFRKSFRKKFRNLKEKSVAESKYLLNIRRTIRLFITG